MSNETTESPMHYYAACGLGWRVAATRGEAIASLAQGFRSDFKRMIANKNKSAKTGDTAGVYVWTCKVHASIDAKYRIEFYMPKGVKISGAQEHSVLRLTSKLVEYIDGRHSLRVVQE